MNALGDHPKHITSWFYLSRHYVTLKFYSIVFYSEAVTGGVL